MYTLTQLTLEDTTEIGAYMRKLAREADSLETVSKLCVQYLHEQLIDPKTGRSACALARFFKTCRYDSLPKDLQVEASNTLSESGEMPGNVRCLTLMGTVGERAEWCDRRASAGHQAIPLTSETAVSRIPMISQLIKDFGLDISCVLAPETQLLMELERKTCNVFYVPKALGSSYIPAQESFVKPFGIRSVVGFGGLLPTSDLFSVILFATVAVPEETARLLKTLPLNIKMAMIPFLKKDTFKS